MKIHLWVTVSERQDYLRCNAVFKVSFIFGVVRSVALLLLPGVTDLFGKRGRVL
jgi:hypothetical protein